ncbi:MAG TPA: PASTA domain-containing protein [Gemmatimonadales bacterium]|nr:PASTA domain-containing protein [Gemmatimonadales bacterium]
MAAGVALVLLTGYLVAALVLFPAPLLPSERFVPRLVGLSEAEARREVRDGDMAVELRAREPHPAAPVGFVIWQDPPPGVAVQRGATIQLTLSDGPPRVAVPDVSGLDPDIAQRLLAAAGLGVDLGDSVTAKGIARGLAASTEPPAGDSARLGSRVVLHLAR